MQAWSDTTGKADTADFGGTAGTITLGMNLGALGLVFESSDYTLATATFPLKLGTGGITTVGNANITSTAGVNIALVGAQAWNVTSDTLTVSSPTATGGFALSLTGAGNHALSGIISGSGSITKNSTVTGLDPYGDVVFTAVPEPATWEAGVLLVGMAGWHLRRWTVRRTA